MGNNIEPFRQKPMVKPTAPEPITLKTYGQRALEYARASGQAIFPTISPGMPEFTAWERYFRNHLGGVPYAFQMALEGKIKAMTVPTQWPEWFDSSFIGSDGQP